MEVADLVVVIIKVADVVVADVVDVRVKVVVKVWLMDDHVRFGTYQRSDFSHQS